MTPPDEPSQPENPPDPILTPQDGLGIYYHMRLAREFELRAIQLYRQGRLVGPLYTGIGHEAVSVASAWALDRGDVIAPMHRDMGARFVRGMKPHEVFAQYMGRVGGPSRGKDGNHHLGSVEDRMIGFASHLGALIPVTVGAALAGRLTGQNYVAMTYIGDGGTSIGDFHEGLNFASVRRLPLVLIIENNQFAYSTPTSHQYACERLVDRAVGYGMAGVTVDGNDAVAVRRARSGEGPTMIEAMTLRVRGHSEHDNASYVPDDLLEEWKARDPLAVFEERLRLNGILSESERRSIESRIQSEIDAAVTFAENSPWPEVDDALSGVYAV